MVNTSLKQLGQTTTTHEPCLYRGVINGQEVIVLQQVDDIEISAKTLETTQQVIDHLNETFDLKIRGIIDDKLFNGVDIEQTNEFIRLSCKKYHTKLEKGHKKWLDKCQKNQKRVPMGEKTLKMLMTAERHQEGSKEAKILEKK